MPQQVIVLSLPKAHVWSPLAVTDLNVPVGEYSKLWSFILNPQQVMVASVRKPQVCRAPEVIVSNRPVGGLRLSGQ